MDDKVKFTLIAKEFGIGRTTIYDIIDRRSTYENHVETGGNLDLYRSIIYDPDRTNSDASKSSLPLVQ